MNARVKLLIDCDPGHDDAVAILFGARHMDLVAITTVHGNNSLDNTTANALKLCALAGIEAPIAVGCAGPLIGPRADIADVHGRTGLDGATFPPHHRRPIATHAVDLIIAEAERHKGELVLAVIGPQTNVAAALIREPRLAGWLREITIMGGSTTVGNVTPAAEFNIHCDPEAAAVVFGCGAPIRMVGLNVTQRTGFVAADIARLRASGRRTAGAIADLMTFYLAARNRVVTSEIAPMHDVCALVPFVAPELMDHVHAHVAVELAGRHTRGMTVCDLRGRRAGASTSFGAEGAKNALVAVDARSPALIDLVMEAVLTYP